MLVAEDNPANYQLVCEFLDVLGHRVSWARNGAEALGMAASGQFEVMLLDLHMPIFDGLQVILAIRSNPDYANLKVIAVTADGGEDARDALIAAGVNSFMAKPLELAKLAAEIDRLVTPSQNVEDETV